MSKFGVFLKLRGGCFIAGTPVLISSRMPTDNIAASVVVTQEADAENWNVSKLSVAAVLIPIGVAGYITTRRRRQQKKTVEWIDDHLLHFEFPMQGDDNLGYQFI